MNIYDDVGKTHDYRMFKDSLADILPENASGLFDSAYQGINAYLINAIIPFKATKNNPLTAEQKAFNKLIAKYRVVIEHINREIKIFRICKETYRGKGERGLLRFKIVAALYNHRCVS